MSLKRIGIAGNGALAASVCWRLMEHGHQALIWGTDEKTVSECVAAGAQSVATLSEVAAKSDIVFVAADSSDESEVWNLSDEGVVEGLREGSIVVDMTNMLPALARRIARACEERNAYYLDAPVSGGAPAARTGNLVIMVGGSERAFDRALPVLEPLGRIIVRIGESGAGAVAKLCNQVMCFVNLCGVCEAFTLGAKAGVDLRKVFNIVSSGAAQSWELDNMGPKILSREFDGGYPVVASQNDLSVVLAAANELKAFLPATSIVHQLYHIVENEGLESKGSQALVRALEKMSNVEVRAGV
jgi:3-hydroxyisobutyrate dehydrogenase